MADNNDINDLIQRTCVSGGYGPYINYNGCFITERYEKFASEIENFEVNDSDIWVSSFPKAGTTWLQELIYLIATDFDYENAKVYLTQRFPFIELGTLFNYDLEPTRDITVNGFPKFRSNSIQYTRQFEGKPRMIKTHLPFFLLPKSIQNGQKQAKVLHITRNPKDVCVSYYYHYIQSHNFKGSFEEFCKLFLADKVLYGPFWASALSYWNKRNDKNVFFVKYEDMKSDLRSVIINVARFLDKALTEEQIEKLLVHLDFDSMKDNSAVNYEAIYRGTSFKQMRKGIVGDHKNMMSEDIIKEFDEWIAKNDPGIFTN